MTAFILLALMMTLLAIGAMTTPDWIYTASAMPNSCANTSAAI